VVYLGVEKKSTDHKTYCSLSVSHRPYLLYVGNRQGYKNFAGFVKAFSASPRLVGKYDIVAFGGGDLSKDELSLFLNLGLNKGQVVYCSGDDAKLASLYESASAFVYPSLYEGFGLPPLEAMSYGCAVISSNTSSMPEVIGNAAEFFNPLCIDQMRDAMENVLFSQARSAELKMFGYARIKDFSWEKCAIETLNVYKKLVHK
ncbi:glycosyltransferase family 4 protein, partial [Marinobacterium sedimentorum]|uniref:glycosyltransferase family 4 protein n=1 Tax=Marinobacterium sedimentorum TaxID=2927804 RepID=UPI0020C694F1